MIRRTATLIVFFATVRCSLLIDPHTFPTPAEILINSTLGGNGQSEPAPAADSQGDLLVAFRDRSGLPPEQAVDPKTARSAIRMRVLPSDQRDSDPHDYPLNTTFGRVEKHPGIAVNVDRRFLVAWSDQGEASDQFGNILGRRIDHTGEPFDDSPIHITTATIGLVRIMPVVASGPDCNFLVVWQEGLTESGGAITGQIVTNDGRILNPQIAIRPSGIGTAAWPSVTSTPNGYFVVWQDTNPMSGTDIRGRRLTMGGVLMDTLPFLVNSTTAGEQTQPVVRADGSIVVVAWNDGSQSKTATVGTEIRMRKFDQNAMPQGGDEVVNTTHAGDQSEPSLAFDGDHTFFVAWTDLSDAPPDTDTSAVRGRRYDLSAPIDLSDFVLNTIVMLEQQTPAATGLPHGFFVAWEDSSGMGDSAKAARGRFFTNNHTSPP
jgi:hypothetical protein